MTLFVGKCLKKRKQQNRRLALSLMLDYNAYEGKYSFFFLRKKLSQKNYFLTNGNFTAFRAMQNDSDKIDQLMMTITMPDHDNAVTSSQKDDAKSNNLPGW